MKKLLGIALLLGLSTSLFAQLPVEITGTLDRREFKPVKVFKVNNGKTEEIAHVQPTNTGRFGFLFYPEQEGLYVVDTGSEKGPSENYTFYFKGGDKLSIIINEDSYTLTGTANSKENMVMNQWFKLTEPLYQKSINIKRVGANSTFVDFFPDLEDIAAKSKKFLDGKVTGNQKFDQRMKEMMELDLADYASSFINSPRTAHPGVEEFSPYYTGLSAQKMSLKTATIYNYPYGDRLLNYALMINMRQKNINFKPGVEGLKEILPLISNDTLKGDFVIGMMGNIKSYPDYLTYANNFGKYFLTAKQKQQQLDIVGPLASLNPGDMGFNFSYPDQTGKSVSMADLKGKVVFVDVWATWCGPCKAQIPFLKKLEEEMKGKDVQFVSISIDDAKDKDKWLKMVKEEQLGGLQLFANGLGDLARFYKISGIPRFMVFDQAGKIVNVNSPRPSDPELKTLLEKTLAN